MNKNSNKQPGFTFVELLFAIVVMGIMFALALVVFIGMLRFYVFAGSVRQNQENSRNLLDSISREIRFGELLLPNNSTYASNSVCVYNNDSGKTQLFYFTANTINRYESKNTYSNLAAAKNQLPSSGSACKPDATNSSIYKLMPSNAYVVSLDINLTRGAKSESNTDATAVIIKMVNITKSSSSTLIGGNSCDTRDIYCNKLILNTAVNIRGGQ